MDWAIEEHVCVTNRTTCVRPMRNIVQFASVLDASQRLYSAGATCYDMRPRVWLAPDTAKNWIHEPLPKRDIVHRTQTQTELNTRVGPPPTPAGKGKGKGNGKGNPTLA